MALRSHAAAIVDDQADSHRYVGMAEMFDWLKYSIFIDLEIVFVESRHQDAFVIERGCLQHHHVYVYADGVVVRGMILCRGRLGESGWGEEGKHEQTSEREGQRLLVWELGHFGCLPRFVP